MSIHHAAGTLALESGPPTFALVLLALAASAHAQSPTIESLVAGQPVRIDQTALTTIGTRAGDPAKELFRVRSPFLLGDDRVAVPLSGYSEIRIYGLNGELIETLGGPGEGPGEFRDLNRAWPRGDTIEAFDRRLMRIVRFLPDGTSEVIRVRRAAGAPTEDVVPQVLSGSPGVFRDGWALSGIVGADAHHRDQLSVLGVRRDGTLEGSIVHVEGLVRDPRMIGPIPLSPRAQVATFGGELYVGETLRSSIRVLDENGNVARELKWEPGRSPHPADAMAEVINLAIQRAAPDRRQQLRERLEATPVPDRVPVFSAFLVDDLGFVWIRPYEIQRDAAALGGAVGDTRTATGGLWWVFTRAGDRLGSVEMPPDLEPHHIARDHVVGIRRDALGVEYVHVHRLYRR